MLLCYNYHNQTNYEGLVFGFIDDARDYMEVSLVMNFSNHILNKEEKLSWVFRIGLIGRGL